MASYKSYKDLLVDNNTNFTNGGKIPKIIFKTSWQTELPKEIVYCLEKTKKLNKEYSLYYFNDADCEHFMKDYSAEYSVDAYEAWKKIIPGPYKADLFRYCIIHKYGGCYSDIGHVMKESFDTIIGESNLVFVKEREYQKVNYGIHNALICSTPGNKIFKKAINTYLVLRMSSI
jgi:mannosyltransferase OCH1-like enzyme